MRCTVSALIRNLISYVPAHWASKEMEYFASVSYLFSYYSMMHSYPISGFLRGLVGSLYFSEFTARRKTPRNALRLLVGNAHHKLNKRKTRLSNMWNVYRKITNGGRFDKKNSCCNRGLKRFTRTHEFAIQLPGLLDRLEFFSLPVRIMCVHKKRGCFKRYLGPGKMLLAGLLLYL